MQDFLKKKISQLKFKTMLLLKKKHTDFETRQEYLLYVALNFIKRYANEDTVFFDDVESDVACLVEDIQIEFDIPDHLIEL